MLILFKNATYSWALRQPWVLASICSLYTTTPLCQVSKILEFVSELPNPRSPSGEIIQNSLNYWNRNGGLLIWRIVVRINFLFKWNSIRLHIYIQNHLKITLKNNEKNTWKFTTKPGKIMEISWNFVSPKKWEPWNPLSHIYYLMSVSQWPPPKRVAFERRLVCLAFGAGFVT